MFPVIEVRTSMAEAVEYLGTKSKFWYSDGDRQVLFTAEERGTGEDWAEEIACELCTLLRLLHVRYEMAMDMEQQRPGVVFASFSLPPLALAHGNQLLLALDPDYPANHLTESRHHYRTLEHTNSTVFELMELL